MEEKIASRAKPEVETVEKTELATGSPVKGACRWSPTRERLGGMATAVGKKMSVPWSKNKRKMEARG